MGLVKDAQKQPTWFTGQILFHIRESLMPTANVQPSGSIIIILAIFDQKLKSNI